MKFEDISPAMREFMGYFEALRRLGFPAESIYCLVNTSTVTNKLAVFAHLEYNSKEFNVECGPIDDAQQALAEYKTICNAFAADSIPIDVQRRLWEESQAYKLAGPLAVSLLLKGIELPANVDTRTNATFLN